MSILFNRICTINIDGRTFKSPPFSIEFEITFKETGLGNAKIKLYNPAQETVDKCKPIKGKKILVSIDAGYKEEYGRVYLGEIVEAKETFNRPDRVLEITLVDLSSNWTESKINKTFVDLPASQILYEICNESGVEFYPDAIGDDVQISKIYISTLESGIKQLAKKTNSRYFVRYGALFFDVADKETERGYDLNYKNGMIGSPELIVKTDKKSKSKNERYKVKSLFLYNIQNSTQIIVNRKNSTEVFRLKVVSGKHTFSSFGNCYTEIEGVKVS